MMSSKDSKKTCPSCGARLPEGAEVCDLCGTPVSASEEEEPQGKEPTAAQGAEGPGEERRAAETGGVYCNACGWENPPEANFCSQCGTRLQEVSGASPKDRPVPAKGPEAAPSGELSEKKASETQQGLARQVTVLVGIALLVVVGLFVATTWSQSSESGSGGAETSAPERTSAAEASSAIEQAEAQPLPAELADSVEVYEERIDQADGEAKLGWQSELVRLFLRNNRPDRAAIVQQRIAEAESTAEAWQRTGDLFFEWMTAMNDESEYKPEVASLTIEAYERVLDEQPDNLDVRTRAAWAYQFDPSKNPMEAIEVTNAVLEEDPEHLQANFNKGLFLLRINRLEEATEQFERVKQVAGEESPFYDAAERYIQAVRDLEARGGNASSGG